MMDDAFQSYAAADLLESFLRCLAGFDGFSPDWRAMSSSAKEALGRLDGLRASHALLAPLSEASLEACLLALAENSESDGMALLTQGAQLWETLQMSLVHIQPLARARGAALIPASLPEVWSMIEAAQIDEGESGEQGAASQAEGTPAIRL